MKKGDLLLCTEMSRLGRNMMMVMAILNECSSKGICIRTIKDGFELSDSINSKIIAFAFSLAAEIERNLISQRTREALAAKKQAGVVLGRPKGHSVKKDTFEKMLPEILRMREEGMSIARISEIIGVHKNTLSKYLKEYYKSNKHSHP